MARLADVHAETLVLELRDLVAANGARPAGPTARLFGYDEEHGTNLVETLRAWLDAFGDVGAAAARPQWRGGQTAIGLAAGRERAAIARCR